MKLHHKSSIFYLITIISLSGLLCFFTLSNNHDWIEDHALFLRQAQSIVHHTIKDCIQKNAFNVKNSSIEQMVVLCPWGFPLLLTPVVYFSDLNLKALKMVGVLLFLLSLFVIYFIFRGKLSKKSCLLLVAMIGFNSFFVHYTDKIMSDIPYFFFALTSLYLIQRFYKERKFIINEPISFLILGALFFYTYYIKVMGIILLPTLFLYQWLIFVDFEKSALQNLTLSRLKSTVKRKYLVHLLPYLFFFLLLFLGDKMLPDAQNYFDFFKGLRIKENLLSYLLISAPDFYPFKYIATTIYLLTLPFFIFGIIKNYRRDFLYLIYSLLLIILIAIYPPQGWFRYIFSIVPFYLYFLFLGLKQIQLKNILPRYFRREFDLSIAFGSILSVIFFLQMTRYCIRNARHEFDNADGAYSKPAMEMYNYVNQSTQPDATFTFCHPILLTLMTNRYALMVTNAEDVLKKKTTFLIIDKFLSKPNQIWQIDSLLKRRADLFKITFVNSQFDIYAIQNQEPISQKILSLE